MASTTELLKKVRKIEIKTKGLSNAIFSGEYHSAFKGRGMSFAEVRQYQFGDDVRAIDWNVSARYNEPFVKVFEEERELTVMLLIDISLSNAFGTQNAFKKDIIAELAAVLSFSAITNNDKVGLIFFTDKIEKFIPPKKGKSHILRIIRDILDFTPERSGTDVSVGLNFLANAVKKRCTCFLMSDFKSPAYDNALRIASRKHDIVGMRIYDKMDLELPDVGIIRLKDLETGIEQWVDTSDRKIRESYQTKQNGFTKQYQTIFSKLGVDSMSIRTDENYIKTLRTFFKKREVRIG